MITFNPNADEAERINCVLTKTHVYNVVGTPGAVFESGEDPYYEGNKMVRGDDGLYRLARQGCYLTEWTDVKFRVVQDHNLDISWPKDEEYWYTAIPETGVYSFYITFNPNTGEVTCQPVKEVLPDFPE